MKPIRSDKLQRLRAAMAATLAALALAACGGGSGVGIWIGGAPTACVSTQGGGTGFALGVCPGAPASAFQPVIASVQVNPGVVAFPSQDGFVLTLTFPATLQSFDGVTTFTSTEQPPASERSLVGILRGQAYENPLRPVLQPGHVGLTDFHRAWSWAADPATATPTLELAHASFGTWQAFPLSTLDDGFRGVWFGQRAASNNPTWPTGPVDRAYEGYLVGVIAPHGAGAAGLPQAQAYGFSAPISLVVDGAGRVASGRIGQLTISYLAGTPAAPAAQGLSIKPIDLSPAGGSADGPFNGTLSTAAGGIGVNVVAGDYEAGYFAAPGPPGAELAGRLRFATDTGLIGIASFGAKFAP